MKCCEVPVLPKGAQPETKELTKEQLIKDVLRSLYSVNSDIEVFDVTNSDNAYEGAIAQLHQLIDQLEAMVPTPDCSGDY